MSVSAKATTITLLAGGPLDISPDVADLFLLQIELWTLPGGRFDPVKRKRENAVARKRARTLKRLAPDKRQQARSIALSLASLLEYPQNV